MSFSSELFNKFAAATRIQALWRGYTVRRDIARHTAYWLAAGIIQTAWRSHSSARKHSLDGGSQRQVGLDGGSHKMDARNEVASQRYGKYEMLAASKIQVRWRSLSGSYHLCLFGLTLNWQPK